MATLSRKIDDVLRPLIPPGSTCALLGCPTHPNVGDSAIWLAEVMYLRKIGARVVYQSSVETSWLGDLTRRLRAGLILLSGGGNFGDLYPGDQHFREAVITAFHDRRIIQLPQTIHFTRSSALAIARRALNHHPDLTVLVRDERSLAFAKGEFRATTLLCPDMAFALGPLEGRARRGAGIVWLARSDAESANPPPQVLPPAVHCTDWLTDTPSALVRLQRSLVRLIGNRPRALRRLTPLLARTFEPVARQRVARGCRILERGSVVITDRLHGHILSVLMGIPHVLLNNSYGKVEAFFQTWTKHAALATWADSPGQALERAHAAAASRAERTGLASTIPSQTDGRTNTR